MSQGTRVTLLYHEIHSCALGRKVGVTSGQVESAGDGRVEMGTWQNFAHRLISKSFLLACCECIKYRSNQSRYDLHMPM